MTECTARALQEVVDQKYYISSLLPNGMLSGTCQNVSTFHLHTTLCPAAGPRNWIQLQAEKSIAKKKPSLKMFLNIYSSDNNIPTQTTKKGKKHLKNRYIFCSRRRRDRKADYPWMCYAWRTRNILPYISGVHIIPLVKQVFFFFSHLAREKISAIFCVNCDFFCCLYSLFCL